MEYDFLRDYALKNIWGAPGQDTQYIIRPSRLTPQHGATRNFKVALQPLGLPDTTSRWHVYQIGGVHPLILNLFARCYEWVALSEACNQKKMIAQVYADSGIVLPNYKTYYRYTSDQNLIMAVQIDSKIPLNPNVEPVYLRVYSNSFFESPRSQGLPGPLQYGGRTLETTGQRTTVENLYTTWAARAGHTWLYVNGFVRSSWTAAPINIGDCVEIVYDPSVYKKLHLKIGELDVFDSALDLKRKYLLHYAGASENHIDFQDDVDVFVTRVVNNDYLQSVYLTKNNEDALRNLTHRDYSVPTTYVRRYVDTFELQTIPRSQIDELDAYLDVYIRRAGFDRPLVFEANRIHELYKLADADIRGAMLGMDSVVDNFRAQTLESSMYTAIMRMNCHDVTNPVVENALGYNAIAKAIADTPAPTVVESNKQVVQVPYKLMWGATAYEYDADGLLLGHYHHYVGSKYTCVNDTARFVELIAGLGSQVLDEHYDVHTMTFSDRHSYRVYECRQYGGAPDNVFRNVTGDTSKYTLNNGVMTWVSNSPTSYVMVRSDARFLAYDLELGMQDGLLTFTLQHLQNRKGQIGLRPMDVAMGQIDLFLNGRSLIQGIDYFVSFPLVHIVSKEHLTLPLSEKQKIHVRFCGFGDAGDNILPEGDTGFVEHGLLSNNNRFDLRDDKVLRIIVDGRLKTRADFTFSEHHVGVAPIDPRNGAPYMVKGILVPVKSQTTTDTYGLKSLSDIIDRRVGDYMTLKLPQPPRNAPTAIPDRYRLFSPFCNALIFDLKYQQLRLTQKPGGYTKQQVIETCKRYEHLLRFDPTQVENQQDLRYVQIEPHCLGHIVELPQYEYQFMHQVVEVYTRGSVVLSGAVRMLNNP